MNNAFHIVIIIFLVACTIRNTCVSQTDNTRIAAAISTDTASATASSFANFAEHYDRKSMSRHWSFGLNTDKKKHHSSS